MRRRRNEEIIAAISFVVVVGMVVSACSDEPRRERLSEQLLMDMRSENEEVVRRACSYLLGNPDKYTERVASVLVEKLRNTGGNEAEKRWPGILMLFAIHKEKASVPVLVELLKRDPGQFLVGLTLGEIRDENAVEPLIAIADKRGIVGESQVYMALGMIGGDRASSFLLERLEAAPDDRRIVKALGETRDKRALNPLLKLWSARKDGPLAMDYLVAISQVSEVVGLPMLLEVSRSPDRERKSVAAEGLGRTHSSVALARLGQMLNEDKESIVQVGVVVGLGIDGSEGAVTILTQELEGETDELLEAMGDGKPIDDKGGYIVWIAEGLSATRRASALVSLMRVVERIEAFGAERYVGSNMSNRTNAMECINKLQREIARLRGSRDLFPEMRDWDFMTAPEPVQSLRRVLGKYIEWWRKDGRVVREMAEHKFLLPFSDWPADPFR